MPQESSPVAYSSVVYLLNTHACPVYARSIVRTVLGTGNTKADGGIT